MPNNLTLKLTVDGSFGLLDLCEETFTYSVSDQSAASGPQAIDVAASAAAGSIDVCLKGMSEQAVLLLLTTKSVTYRLNGESLDRTINENGFVVLAGDPVITSLKLGGNGQTAAVVNIIQLGTLGTPPAVSVVGYNAIAHPLDDGAGGPVSVAQTVFTLPSVPLDPTNVWLSVEGLTYYPVIPIGGTEPPFTISGTTLTLTGTTPIGPLVGGERVEAIYT